MLHIPGTILPLFAIILLGYFLKRRKVIDSAFVRTANQIVFYIAIPAMLFNSIARAPFRENFNLTAVFCLLGALLLQLVLSVAAGKGIRVPRKSMGTFLQSSFHGNLGYMAYAVAYYSLGKLQFARTAILSSFLMIAQNCMAVWVLVYFRPDRSPAEKKQKLPFFKAVYQNPIILTVLISMIYSGLHLPVPYPVVKVLDILSGMALPTALILIGAGLSFTRAQLLRMELLMIGGLKLICLPAIGIVLMKLARVPHPLVLPGMILLAAPSATVTYVMARELGGDPELAASSISLCTLASAVTYSLLLYALL